MQKSDPASLFCPIWLSQIRGDAVVFAGCDFPAFPILRTNEWLHWEKRSAPEELFSSFYSRSWSSNDFTMHRLIENDVQGWCRTRIETRGMSRSYWKDAKLRIKRVFLDETQVYIIQINATRIFSSLYHCFFCLKFHQLWYSNEHIYPTVFSKIK